MTKSQLDADRPTEDDGTSIGEQVVEDAPIEIALEPPVAQPAVVEAPAQPPPPAAKEVHMPLMICSTCQGRRCVRHGGRMYVCPSCQGSGGVPLGQAPAVAPPPPRTGLSRAGHHLARGVPNSMPVGQRRRR
jgi:hypothetical protein